MAMPQEAPYGTWTSPLSADIFAAGAISLNEVVVNGSDEHLLVGSAALIKTGSDQMAKSTYLR
jgi:hypothetical protein